MFLKNEGKDGKAGPSGRERRKDKSIDFLGNPNETLIELAKCLPHEEIFLIIDALDECTHRIEERLFECLRNLLKANEVKFKVLVSSRPERDVTNELEPYLEKDLSKHNHEGIVKRVDAALKDLVNLTPIQRMRVKQEMISKAESQFTYIELAVGILRQPWVRPVNNVIAKFEKGVARLYQETVKKH